MSAPSISSTLHDDPYDILVKSTQEQTQEAIPAHSRRLALGSHVFQSMIDIGSMSSDPNSNSSEGGLPVVEVNERHELLVLLINLLESPLELPPPKVNNEIPSSAVSLSGDAPSNVLPWPLITTLLDMADKYDLSDNIMALLHAHIQSHASSYPLQVYALASRLELPEIASLASSFLLHPPLDQYSVSDIKLLPSAVAYHLLLVLQNHRREKLMHIVGNEPIFPHEYGACSKHGMSPARLAWETRKGFVVKTLHAGTSVADSMECDSEIEKELMYCSDCCMGWERAVEMIRYKAGKVPRSISQLPSDIL